MCFFRLLRGFMAKDSTCVWLPWPYHFARGLRQSRVSDLESVLSVSSVLRLRRVDTCRPCRPRVDFFQGQQFDQLLLPWPRFRFFRCFVGVFYPSKTQMKTWRLGNCRNPWVFSVLEILRGLSGYVGDAVVNCSVPGESCLTEAQFGGLGGPGGCSHPVCSLSLRSEKWCVYLCRICIWGWLVLFDIDSSTLKLVWFADLLRFRLPRCIPTVPCVVPTVDQCRMDTSAVHSLL